MLTGAGLDRVWHHSRAHRLFTNARWSGDALGLALADLIVARLLPAGAALTIAVDDTLFKRSGKKVLCVAWHHDGRHAREPGRDRSRPHPKRYAPGDPAPMVPDRHRPMRRQPSVATISVVRPHVADSPVVPGTSS